MLLISAIMNHFCWQLIYTLTVSLLRLSGLWLCVLFLPLCLILSQNSCLTMSDWPYWPVDNSLSQRKCPYSHVRQVTDLKIQGKSTIFTPNWGRHTWANHVDQDETLQNAAVDQILHCLSLIQQVLDTATSIKMDFRGIFDGNSEIIYPVLHKKHMLWVLIRK